MSSLDVVLGEHRVAIVDAACRHNATAIAFVGSNTRDSHAELSNCDFLADFAPGTTYFDLSDLVFELESLLGCGVMVIPSTGLEPGKHARILKNAVPLC